MAATLAHAARGLAYNEVSFARDNAVETLVRLDVAKDRPLTPEEFEEVMRRITKAKADLHNAAVRVRRSWRLEEKVRAVEGVA